MLAQLKKDLKLNGDNMAVLPCMMLLGYVMGMALYYFLVKTDTDAPSKWICMGTLMALVMSVFVLIIHCITHYSEYMLSLSMGRTRKEILLSIAVRRLGEYILGYLFLLALYNLERLLVTAWYPVNGNLIDFDFLYDMKIVIPVILGLLVLTMFLGTLYCRFGKKFLTIAYFVWLGGCLLFPWMIPDEEHTGFLADVARVLMGWCTAIGASGWVVIGIAAAVAMAGTTVYLGRKEMYR